MEIVTMQMGFLNWFFGVLILSTIFFAIIGFVVTLYYINKWFSSFVDDFESSIGEWWRGRKKKADKNE